MGGGPVRGHRASGGAAAALASGGPARGRLEGAPRSAPLLPARSVSRGGGPVSTNGAGPPHRAGVSLILPTPAVRPALRPGCAARRSGAAHLSSAGPARAWPGPRPRAAAALGIHGRSVTSALRGPAQRHDISPRRARGPRRRPARRDGPRTPRLPGCSRGRARCAGPCSCAASIDGTLAGDQPAARAAVRHRTGFRQACLAARSRSRTRASLKEGTSLRGQACPAPAGASRGRRGLGRRRCGRRGDHGGSPTGRGAGRLGSMRWSRRDPGRGRHTTGRGPRSPRWPWTFANWAGSSW